MITDWYRETRGIRDSSPKCGEPHVAARRSAIYLMRHNEANLLADYSCGNFVYLAVKFSFFRAYSKLAWTRLHHSDASRNPEGRVRVACLDFGLRRNDGYFVQSKKKYALIAKSLNVQGKNRSNKSRAELVNVNGFVSGRMVFGPAIQL